MGYARRGSSRWAGLIILVTAFFSLVTSCHSSKQAVLSTTAQIEKKLGLRPSVNPLDAFVSQRLQPDRRVAQSAPRCLKDRLSDKDVKQEVLQMEKSRAGDSISGKWNGKDLLKLPRTQGQFLSENSNWIKRDGLDYTSCDDLPCILNVPYGPHANGEGWRVYGLYLKTGYSLSLRDYVPEPSRGAANGRPDNVSFDRAPFSAHLFSSDELKSFWKLSHVLPDSLLFLPSLQRFHRIPPLDEFDKANDPMLRAGYDESWCGESWGTQSVGFIRMRRCMEEDFNETDLFFEEYKKRGEEPLSENGLRGKFYLYMTHELVHSWDRAMSKASVLVDRPSLLKEWLDLGGWRRDTVEIPRNEYIEKYQKDCSLDPYVTVCTVDQWVGDAKVTRAYAANSPVEDLAETAAWARFRPEAAASRVPAKLPYVSEKIFGGRTFDSAGLNSYYESTAVKTVSPLLVELVNACVTEQSREAVTETSVAGIVHLAFEQPLPEGVVACLERGLGERITYVFDGLRATEWEACDQFAKNEAELRVRVFAALNPEITRLVRDSVAQAPILKATRDLRAAVAAQVDPREGYIHCRRQSHPELCYSQALGDAFERAAATYTSTLGDLYAQEKEAYLSQHSYSQSQNLTQQFYQGFLSGTESQVQSIAESRWKACLEIKSGSEVEPLFEPYSGGTHFVSARLLSCLNRAIDGDLQTLRNQHLVSLGMTVSDAEVEALLSDLLRPGYLSVLQGLQQPAALAEDELRLQRKGGVLDVLVSELNADSHWLDEAHGQVDAASRCEEASSHVFDGYFAHVSAEQQLPTRFAALEDIRVEWSKEACKRVLVSASVAERIEKQSEAVWIQAMKGLDQLVQARVNDQITDCMARHPGRSSSKAVRNQRQYCLTMNSTWKAIEAQALVDWEQTSDGREYAARRKDAQNYLKKNRFRLQKSAQTAMDSRAK